MDDQSLVNRTPPPPFPERIEPTIEEPIRMEEPVSEVLPGICREKGNQQPRGRDRRISHPYTYNRSPIACGVVRANISRQDDPRPSPAIASKRRAASHNSESGLGLSIRIARRPAQKLQGLISEDVDDTVPRGNFVRLLGICRSALVDIVAVFQLFRMPWR